MQRAVLHTVTEHTNTSECLFLWPLCKQVQKHLAIATQFSVCPSSLKNQQFLFWNCSLSVATSCMNSKWKLGPVAPCTVGFNSYRITVGCALVKGWGDRRGGTAHAPTGVLFELQTPGLWPKIGFLICVCHIHTHTHTHTHTYTLTHTHIHTNTHTHTHKHIHSHTQIYTYTHTYTHTHTHTH